MALHQIGQMGKNESLKCDGIPHGRDVSAKNHTFEKKLLKLK